MKEMLTKVAQTAEYTYTCYRCGETFVTDQTNEEAMAEAHAVFGDILKTNGDLEVVCDDCYNLIMAHITN